MNIFVFIILCVVLVIVFHIFTKIELKKFKRYLEDTVKMAKNESEQLVKDFKRNLIMDNYIFKNKNGHIEVYDRKGNFILSADSEAEAEREIENM